MGIQDTLTQTICRGYHPDYWSDDVVTRAGAILAELQPDDWDWLAGVWPQWCAEYQQQLASALLGSGPPAWPILEAMIGSADVRVGEEAATSLQADAAWPGRADLHDDLLRVRAGMDRSLRRIVDDLDARSG